ncbi:competence protein [Pedobacter sp. AW1-32]|uniref:competence protein n=1 Tax=Pedobacter sp. AW1-32 TaxID=3383026 RepID=UPI003FF0551F
MEWKSEHTDKTLQLRETMQWEMGLPVMPGGVERFYKNETPWHRNWKMAFPESFREKAFVDCLSGEIHRGDVHTPCGTTLEFQNSPITAAEILSRESFYSKLIWVVNGKKLKGFRVLKNMPDVEDPILSDYEFIHSDHLALVQKQDILSGKLPRIINLNHPTLKNLKISAKYYSFCWKNPHTAWFSARHRIVVDMGGHFLYEIRTRVQSNGDYAFLQLHSRKAFIEQFLLTI